MAKGKSSSFNTERKGFPPLYLVQNLNMCHLQKVDDTLVDGCGDLRAFAQFQRSKLSGLFQDFIDGYIEYYNFSQ